MQFKSIVAFVSLAAMTVAVPTNPAPAPAPANQCKQGQVLSCCDSFIKSTPLGSVLPINLGIGCVVVNVLAALNPTCAGSQKLACCNASGPQTGLVNVGNVCPNVL
ncbi:MAG: hypothetical protein Q9212_004877 [Teloschistes hypoglaucus]